MGLNLGGGSWLKLDKKYGVFTAKVTDVEERDLTFDGAIVKSKAGNVRREWVLTFEVPESEDFPEGVAKVSFKEGGKIAIAKAVREAGGKVLDAGGTLTIKVTKDSVQGKSGAEYAAKWVMPTNSIAVDADPFADDAPASSAAPF